jgi:glycine cleavage system H protein
MEIINDTSGSISSMNVPKDLQYTKTHEWVRHEDDGVTVGITDFAQAQLSDVTYVELPAVGDQVNTEDEVAVLESVKAASDIYAPVSGVVVAVNTVLNDSPELVNSDPYGDGWLFRLEPDNEADLDELLDADQYEESIPDQ